MDDEPPELAVTESRVGHRLVLAAEGEVDVASVDMLCAALDAAAQSGCAEVWLDLSELEFMDSTGITAIIVAHTAFNSRRFALICPPGPIRRVLEIAGIEHAIPVYATRSDAHSAP
jgi:anti-anti-sigma factor